MTGIEHFQIQAGEVRLHCAAAGPADGPLVVLLHGFPDCWITWRNQLPALAAAGFRAVAPDLRGYGGSDKPRGVAAYRVENLARDVAELIKALGREKADVVGHDWGGHVAWHFAMWHPEKLRRLALCNMPHPQRMARGLRTARQLRKSWYIFFFQLPFLPERFISDAALRSMYKRFSSDDEIRVIQEAVRDRTPPINYYRAAVRHPVLRWQPIEAETLIVWGQRDPFLGEELAEPSPRWVPHARVERIPDASHWVQAEAPARVNELLLAFLR